MSDVVDVTPKSSAEISDLDDSTPQRIAEEQMII